MTTKYLMYAEEVNEFTLNRQEFACSMASVISSAFFFIVDYVLVYIPRQGLSSYLRRGFLLMGEVHRVVVNSSTVSV